MIGWIVKRKNRVNQLVRDSFANIQSRTGTRFKIGFVLHNKEQREYSIIGDRKAKEISNKEY